MSEKKSFFRATAEDFKKIPGSPVAYWFQEGVSIFTNAPLLSHGNTRQGFATGDNNRFLRYWEEVSFSNMAIGVATHEEARLCSRKWFPCHKGGSFRKWYGNHEYVANWENDGSEMTEFPGSVIRNPQYYFRSGLNWSSLSSGTFGMRMGPVGFLFESKGSMFFANDNGELRYLLGAMNSSPVNYVLKVLAPTLDYHEGPVSKTPIASLSDVARQTVEQTVDALVTIACKDWNSYETSWDFKVNPLVALARENSISNTIATLHVTLREKWVADCEEMRRLETENNRIFIDAYGLQDDLTPDVPWHEITLTCNPWYKYRKNKKKDKKSQGEGEDNIEQVMLTREEKELMSADDFPLRADKEELLRCDTAKDLVSYAVGCMMGRYSLDKAGLILADQGATEADYYSKIGLDKAAAKFAVDDDGIIPILDNDWFQDDIVTRFKEFIKVAFGEEHFLENMTWIEDALGKDIRSYFTKDFYKDHLQRYQNRPIYWLFQSPKGAFRALVYMHRYKPDMVGGVLGYLRSLQTKIDNQLDVAMQVGADELKSASERVRANKDAVKFAKAKKELDEYEKNVLYPLSTERTEIDLDDGVKVNYRKFGSALRKVAALEAKGEVG